MNVYKYLSALLTVLCLTLGMTGASFADNVQTPKATPQDGKTYAGDMMNAWEKAFKDVHACIKDKIPDPGTLDPNDSSKEKQFMPDIMYKCEPQLAVFETIRLDLDRANLTWHGSEQEIKAIFDQAALIDRIHRPIVRIFNFLIRGLGRDSSARKAMTAYYKILLWYEDKGKDYKVKLKEIDNLLTEYYNYKTQGKMVGDHFEAPSSAMRGMNSVVKKLAEYFDYNVDTKTLRAMKKGVFLYDLDKHSTGYSKNIDNCVSMMNAACGIAKNVFSQSHSKDMEALEKMDKNAFFYQLASIIPGVMKDIEDRVTDALDVTLKGMRWLATGDSNVTKFLTQKDLEQDTHFAPNTRYSFIYSIRTSCYQILLNTKDKKGREIKHSTHGGKFFLDFPPPDDKR